MVDCETKVALGDLVLLISRSASSRGRVKLNCTLADASVEIQPLVSEVRIEQNTVHALAGLLFLLLSEPSTCVATSFPSASSEVVITSNTRNGT